MAKVSGVPYEVELEHLEEPEAIEKVHIRLAIEAERRACLEIAEIPGMTPVDIARCIRERGGV